MKHALLVLLAVLAVSALAPAAVIDDFDDLGVNDRYTPRMGGSFTNVASGAGYSGMATADGSPGLARLPLTGAIHQIEAFIWDGPERVTDGDIVDLWVTVNPVTYAGAGVVVKTCHRGGYAVGLGRGNHEMELVIMIHNLGRDSPGQPLGFTHPGLCSGVVDNVLRRYEVGNDYDSWYHIIAQYHEVDPAVEVHVTLNKGAPGNETFVASGVLVDDRAFGNWRDGPGQPGVFYAAWSRSGADVDNLGYVPEPVCLALLTLAAAGMLRRRRRG